MNDQFMLNLIINELKKNQDKKKIKKIVVPSANTSHQCLVTSTTKMFDKTFCEVTILGSGEKINNVVVEGSISVGDVTTLLSKNGRNIALPVGSSEVSSSSVTVLGGGNTIYGSWVTE